MSGRVEVDACHQGATPPLLTVCICTYNRAALLERMLATLAAQEKVDWGQIELLVVDNNSRDSTAAVVAAASGSLPLRRVVEKAQGLSHARNRALAEAGGDWIIFTDDDVILDLGWLREYAQAIGRYPEAAFAGGRITPYWDGSPPAWYRGERLDGLDGLLVWYDLGTETRTLKATEPEPFGASLALRRSLASKIGPFRTDLGPRADAGRGDDTEFIRRARSAGAVGIYVGAARCRHFADPRRFTLRALYRHGVFKGVAHRAMTDPRASGSGAREILYLVRGVRQLLIGRGDRFRQCVINAGVQRGLIRSTRADDRKAIPRHAR